jgi:LAO/AO transport system kinase
VTGERDEPASPFRSALSVAPAGAGMPPRSVAGPIRRRELTVAEYVDGVRTGNRTVLARTITLIESNSERHLETAQQVLAELIPHSGRAHRIGITGVPGVGKSTFIETFGTMLTGEGRRVAVLAIDPSSGISGGSILGDKTRMIRLSTDPNAFVRPSPTAGTLGGVARKTRESMLVCEAAGFDVVLVETVGVGQSETVVAEMTDFFLALMLPGAGDELQGIKRGLLELTDMIAVNKADGDNLTKARRAAREYRNALHSMAARAGWQPRVALCSAVTGMGLDEIWTAIREHHEQLDASGELEARRRAQLLRWMDAMIEEQLRVALREHPAVRRIWGEVEGAVREGRTPPTSGARQILEAFLGER